MDIKACKDCKYFENTMNGKMTCCYNNINNVEFDPINGVYNAKCNNHKNPLDMRKGECGLEGKLFKKSSAYHKINLFWNSPSDQFINEIKSLSILAIPCILLIISMIFYRS